MKVLCTFPGRAGDLIWALPSVRAISEAYDTPVDLLIAGEFVGMLPLLREGAPYLARVEADPGWSLTPPEEWMPPRGWTCLDWNRVGEYDRVYHLGYRGWPECPLAQYTYERAQTECPDTLLLPLYLEKPWLTLPTAVQSTRDVSVGFTEAWFELKVGLLHLLDAALPDLLTQMAVPAGRWENEPNLPKGTVYPCDWLSAAHTICHNGVFLGDCSALHVLARALGKPVVLCEPMKDRWNAIFYPYGKTGHGVELVLGNDGLPTFDARAVAEALRVALGKVTQ